MMNQKTVLITGASRGIGLRIKNRFSSSDWTVLSPSRRELDLSDRDSVTKYLDSLKSPIDILINNAGENPIHLFSEIDLKVWDQVQQVNLTSPFMLIQRFAPAMAARNFGRIVNISSIYSSQARTGRAAYCASKAALDALTRAAAIEYSAHGVLVNSVCPGFIDTDLTRKNNSMPQIEKLLERVPVGHLGESDSVAELVYFLVSEKNTFISGQCIQIDGGFSIS